ncbi:hypothetical protein C3489_12345 [Streptomyces sp. Ru71]|uniref:hypothetical protein n=1 Tax=Streptomyces sp. Ru71 TaxID=2080746 RepID=UPI000CDDFD12|nr:hypothetical protein [Streptomyces sp. Ru71]POX55095.1 hypothetical protein C3489_12345 [Streptomyces sp. Ru71]
MSPYTRDPRDPAQPWDGRAVPAARDTRPWYLRWGAEPALAPSRVCHPDCSGSHPDDVAPTDLFCPAGGFLPLRDASPGVRRVVLSLPALVLPGSVSLSARWHSPLPLLLPALGCAALFTLAPLRPYPTTRRVAALLLLLAGVTGAVVHWGGATARTVTLTSLLAASALLWAWCAGRMAWHGGHTGLAARTVARPRGPGLPGRAARDRHEAWMLPGALTFGAAAGALPVLAVEAALRYSPDGWLWDPPQAVRLWLTRAPWLAVLGALLTAVLAGLLHGVRTFDATVAPLIPRPRPLPLFEVPRPRWRPRPAAGHGPLDQLVLVVGALADLLLMAAVAAACVVLDILIVSADLLLRALVALGNLLWRVLVCVTRLLVSAVTRALEVLGQAALLGGGALVRSVRVAVLPPVLLGVQVACAWSFAASGSAYGETGALADLRTALIAPLLGHAAAVATWCLWCGERPGRCMGSASRSGRHVAIWTAVLVPVTSWLVCAPYVITGQGPVRPGPVCYGSTGLLAGALALGLANRRRGAGKRAVVTRERAGGAGRRTG